MDLKDVMSLRFDGHADRNSPLVPRKAEKSERVIGMKRLTTVLHLTRVREIHPRVVQKVQGKDNTNVSGQSIVRFFNVVHC